MPKVSAIRLYRCKRFGPPRQSASGSAPVTTSRPLYMPFKYSLRTYSEVEFHITPIPPPSHSIRLETVSEGSREVSQRTVLIPGFLVVCGFVTFLDRPYSERVISSVLGGGKTLTGEFIIFPPQGHVKICCKTWGFLFHGRSRCVTWHRIDSILYIDYRT